MLETTPIVPYHVRLLISELERRKQRNPRYSLRAFSAHLELHPSAVSRLLLNKRSVSVQAYASIAKKLNLSLEEKKRFIVSVAEEKAHRASQALATALAEDDLH